ncbi:Hypothetical predicted protein [Prunus dulcis]|uniref:Uncharacterized protein n=1 Tax=Prunus dulcis TaxID=3755 RepID=A0A5E4EJT7_PRUDU|nr:Hypothetical predicted protein [Prunus dulcis]
MSFFTFPSDVESQILGILLPRLLTLGHLMSHFVDVGRLLPKHLLLVKEHAAHVRGWQFAEEVAPLARDATAQAIPPQTNSEKKRVSIWTATIQEDRKNIWTTTIV